MEDYFLVAPYPKLDYFCIQHLRCPSEVSLIQSDFPILGNKIQQYRWCCQV